MQFENTGVLKFKVNTDKLHNADEVKFEEAKKYAEDNNIQEALDAKLAYTWIFWVELYKKSSKDWNFNYKPYYYYNNFVGYNNTEAAINNCTVKLTRPIAFALFKEGFLPEWSQKNLANGAKVSYIVSKGKYLCESLIDKIIPNIMCQKLFKEYEHHDYFVGIQYIDNGYDKCFINLWFDNIEYAHHKFFTDEINKELGIDYRIRSFKEEMIKYNQNYGKPQVLRTRNSNKFENSTKFKKSTRY